MFIALGLTIAGPSDLVDDTPEASSSHWQSRSSRGRSPLLLLAPVPLRLGEKLFVMWSGLKGAVPILLAAFVLVADVDNSLAVYNIVFVVVAFSVIVQGSLIATVAERLGVPMRIVEPEPWDVSDIRLREPGNVQRYTIGSGSRVVGSTIRDVPLGERAWISFVVRDGQARQARGTHVLRVGDEVHVLGDPEDSRVLQRLFEGRAGDALARADDQQDQDEEGLRRCASSRHKDSSPTGRGLERRDACRARRSRRCCCCRRRDRTRSRRGDARPSPPSAERGRSSRVGDEERLPGPPSTTIGETSPVVSVRITPFGSTSRRTPL